MDDQPIFLKLLKDALSKWKKSSTNFCYNTIIINCSVVMLFNDEIFKISVTLSEKIRGGFLRQIQILDVPSAPKYTTATTLSTQLMLLNDNILKN